MTAFLPLDAAAPCPPSPAFLVPTPDPAGHVKRVVKAVLKARRIAVVCGAGISVQAGIPDFRSSEGLFQSLKKDHPTLSSGKDLFDASVFSSVGQGWGAVVRVPQGTSAATTPRGQPHG
ncbi:hypothetical protein GSI_02511 [Ganoderma sinense ZZ0214-1]|uniref:Uncharacterized protein n=1 Tax=Ganoderma sinense ZZ0214-1 TaxID=1077348 RepID=A0A2G8SPS9_9APHY|nr:hypothetical protein GSI_02511 [Ganoderma sinense ZZ0214-1]